MTAGPCELPDVAPRAAGAADSWVPTLVLDVASVLLVALAGQVAHADGDLATGTAVIAAPFVLGLLAGWVRAPCAGLPAARRARTVRFGGWLVAWAMAGGVALPWLLGDERSPAFLAVAAALLSLLLVGRRALVGLSRAPRRPARRS